MTEEAKQEDTNHMDEDQYFGLICMVAELAHEVNRGYCQHIGDDSQPSWVDAPEWQQNSAIQGVVFKISNPDTTPEQMHKNWLAEKTRTGWIYGEVKDPEHKMHPCMVPYSQLPENQKAKDVLFQSVVVTMCKQFGLIPRG